MANPPFLLESKFNFKPFLQQTFRLPYFPIKLSSGDHNSFKLNYPSYKVIKDYHKLRTKCFITTHIPKGNNGIGGSGDWEEINTQAVTISSGVDEVSWRSINNVVKASQKPVITGGFLGLLFLYDHHALAASLAVRPAVGVKLGFCAIMMMLGSTLTVVAYCLRWLFATKLISVLKLQVGLLDTGKLLQKDLNRIAQRQHFLYFDILNIASPVYMKRSIEEVENRFNQLCTEERGKFDVETLVNVNNIGKQRATTQRSRDFPNEYIVITIIVGVQGGHKLPPINSGANLKEALQTLASIPSSRIEAVAVLLTPQNEIDTRTAPKFQEDYSLLHPL